jgi:hypothetical protein
MLRSLFGANSDPEGYSAPSNFKTNGTIVETTSAYRSGIGIANNL